MPPLTASPFLFTKHVYLSEGELAGAARLRKWGPRPAPSPETVMEGEDLAPFLTWVWTLHLTQNWKWSSQSSNNLENMATV